MDGTIHPFPAPGPVLTVVRTPAFTFEGGAILWRGEPISYATAEGLHQGFMDATRKARADGDFDAQTEAFLCATDVFKALQAADRYADVQGLARDITANNSLERAIGGGERLWAIDSDNGAA